jgi:hypothetical protein
VLFGPGPGRYSLDRLIGLRLPRGLTRLTVLGATALTAYSAVQVAKTKWTTTRDEGVRAAPESAASEAT